MASQARGFDKRFLFFIGVSDGHHLPRLQASIAAQVVADREAKGLTAEFVRGGDIEGFGRRVGIDALGKGRGFAQARAAGALRRRWHIISEAGNTRYHDSDAPAATPGPVNRLAHPNEIGQFGEKLRQRGLCARRRGPFAAVRGPAPCTGCTASDRPSAIQWVRSRPGDRSFILR